MKYTYEIVSEFIQEFWKVNRLEDEVLCLFEQKYTWEKEWHEITVIAYDSDGIGDPPVFSWDFCEGETDIRKFMCLYLEDAAHILRDIIEERRRNNEPPEI